MLSEHIATQQNLYSPLLIRLFELSYELHSVDAYLSNIMCKISLVHTKQIYIVYNVTFDYCVL